MNDKFGKLYKGAVVTHFILSLPWGLEDNLKKIINFGQDIESLGEDVYLR
jgi:hypothetical protein